MANWGSLRDLVGGHRRQGSVLAGSRVRSRPPVRGRGRADGARRNLASSGVSTRGDGGDHRIAGLAGGPGGDDLWRRGHMHFGDRGGIVIGSCGGLVMAWVGEAAGQLAPLWCCHGPDGLWVLPAVAGEARRRRPGQVEDPTRSRRTPESGHGSGMQFAGKAEMRPPRCPATSPGGKSEKLESLRDCPSATQGPLRRRESITKHCPRCGRRPPPRPEGRVREHLGKTEGQVNRRESSRPGRDGRPDLQGHAGPHSRGRRDDVRERRARVLDAPHPPPSASSIRDGGMARPSALQSC